MDNKIEKTANELFQKGDKVFWNGLEWTCGKLNFKNQRKIFRKERGIVKIEWIGEKFLKIANLKGT
jgi:hypothetical protein